MRGLREIATPISFGCLAGRITLIHATRLEVFLCSSGEREITPTFITY